MTHRASLPNNQFKYDITMTGDTKMWNLKSLRNTH